MRKLSVLFVSLLMSLVAVAAAWAPAQAAAAPRIAIGHHASKMYMYDPSPSGDGTVKDPATNVTAVFVNCPAGDYQLNATLNQGGNGTYWATQGRGAGEFTCDGTTRRVVLHWAFAGPKLHPGRALAKFALYRAVCADDLCTTESTPTVSSRAVVGIPRR